MAKHGRIGAVAHHAILPIHAENALFSAATQPSKLLLGR